MSQPPTTPLRREPINPELIKALEERTRTDLAASFDLAARLTISYAPARIEAMGKITDYCGSKYVAMPATTGTAVAIQPRNDRQISIFSFNLFDQHKPFTLIAPLKALTSDYKALRTEFAESGRTWAGYVAGVFSVLHQENIVNLDSLDHGFNIAILGNTPMGMGFGTSASLITTTMNAVCALLDINPDRKAELCQKVENHLIGLPSGPLDFETVESAPQESKPFHFVGITTGQEKPLDLKHHQRLRCGSFIAHKLILEKMKQYGHAANRELIADPMQGKLANLSLDDYRKYFRGYLLEEIKGGHFLLEFGKTIDPISTIEPDWIYTPQKTADFQIFQANRIRNFLACLSKFETQHELKKAGHLLYAAHISYQREALIHDPNCDLLVDLVKHNEPRNLHGGKITGHGGGIVVLCDRSDRADEAILDIMQAYKDKTGLTPTRINPCH